MTSLRNISSPIDDETADRPFWISRSGHDPSEEVADCDSRESRTDEAVSVVVFTLTETGTNERAGRSSQSGKDTR